MTPLAGCHAPGLLLGPTITPLSELFQQAHTCHRHPYARTGAGSVMVQRVEAIGQSISTTPMTAVCRELTALADRLMGAAPVRSHKARRRKSPRDLFQAGDASGWLHNRSKLGGCPARCLVPSGVRRVTRRTGDRTFLLRSDNRHDNSTSIASNQFRLCPSYSCRTLCLAPHFLKLHTGLAR